MRYALDTNTIIHLIRGTPTVRTRRTQAQNEGAMFFIPPFVHYEMQRGLFIRPIPSHIQAYEIIAENCLLGEMNAPTWQRAARIYADLYAQHFTVSDSDIIIAAYCLEHDCTLVTNNTNDFKNIHDLHLVDWV